MRRKVIQIADSTQLVSLPRKWAVEHGVKKGDEVEVKEEGNRIIISTEKGLDLGSIEVDITDLDRTSIIYCIQSLYRLGYDEIKVIYNRTVIEDVRVGQKVNVLSIIHYITNRLLGFEIMQQKGNSCVIRDIQEIKEKDFDQILRRVFLLWADTFHDFLEGIKNNNRGLIESIEQRHDSITKLISYCLRILNKKGYHQDNKTFVLYHLIANIDKVIDVIKHSARDFLQQTIKVSKHFFPIVERIIESIDLYNSHFYKFDLSKVQRISENRVWVKKEIRSYASSSSIPELLLLEDLKFSLELLMDLTESRWGLEY